MKELFHVRRRSAPNPDRDRFRIALLRSWDPTFEAIFGDCAACANLARHALALAEWSLDDFLLMRPLPPEAWDEIHHA